MILNKYLYLLVLKQRFLHELELKSLMEKIFYKEKFYLQELFYEHSFNFGLVVKINILSLKKYSVHSSKDKKLKQKKLKISYKMKKNFSKIKNLKFNSLLKKKTTWCFKKSLLSFYFRKKTFLPFVLFFSSSTVIYFFNKKFILFLKLLHKSQQNLQNFKNIFLIFLSCGLAVSFPGQIKILLFALLKLFFKSRQHQYNFFNFMVLQQHAFQLSKSFSKILGLFFQVCGRLDKDPRTKKQRFFLGKVNQQSITGFFEKKRIAVLTKNGIFGFFLWLRFNSKKNFY